MLFLISHSLVTEMNDKLGNDRGSNRAPESTVRFRFTRKMPFWGKPPLTVLGISDSARSPTLFIRCMPPPLMCQVTSALIAVWQFSGQPETTPSSSVANDLLVGHGGTDIFRGFRCHWRRSRF